MGNEKIVIKPGQDILGFLEKQKDQFCSRGLAFCADKYVELLHGTETYGEETRHLDTADIEVRLKVLKQLINLVPLLYAKSKS